MELDVAKKGDTNKQKDQGIIQQEAPFLAITMVFHEMVYCDYCRALVDENYVHNFIFVEQCTLNDAGILTLTMTTGTESIFNDLNL